MAVPARKTMATRPLVRTARARAGPEGVGVEIVARPREFQGFQEAVEAGGEQEREQDVGNEDAGEEEDSGGGEHAEAGVEGGAFAEGLARPAVAEQHEQQNGERLRQVRGEGVAAEDAEADGGDPVGQRSFFEVADVVHTQGDPVAGEGHLAGGVGVGAVGVVEHRRGE